MRKEPQGKDSNQGEGEQEFSKSGTALSLHPKAPQGSGGLNVPPLLSLPLFYCQNEPPKLSIYKPWVVLKPPLPLISLLLCHQLQGGVSDLVWLCPSALAFPAGIAPAGNLRAPSAQVWVSLTPRGSSLVFPVPQLEHPPALSCIMRVGQANLARGEQTMENPWKFTHSPRSGQVMQFSSFFLLIFM